MRDQKPPNTGGSGFSYPIPKGLGDLNYLQSLLKSIISQDLSFDSAPTFLSITLTNLTASLLVGTNAAKALQSISVGGSLSLSGTTLNTIQNLRTIDGPTFAGLTLTTGAGASKVWTSDANGLGSWATAALAAHALDGASHTVSALTPGHFLKATGATTFGFAAHGLTYSDVGAEVSGAVATHAALITGVHGLVFTAGKALTLQKSMTLTAFDDAGVYTFPTGTKTLLAADGSPAALVIASQATGDLLYASSATAWARLGIGAAGQALVVNAGGTLPVWGTVLANPMDAQGQLIYGGAAGAPTKLAAGTATYLLQTTGAAGSETPGWVACTGTGAPVRAGSPVFTTQTSILATGVAFTTGKVENTNAGSRSAWEAYDGSASIGIRAHGSTYSETIFGISATGSVGLIGYPTASCMMVGCSTNFPLILGTNASERMRIAAGGNVTIGAAIDAYTTLHVVKTSAGAIAVPLKIQNASTATSTETALQFISFNSDTPTGQISNKNTDGAGNYSLSMGPYGNFNALTIRNGQVGIGATPTANSPLRVAGLPTYSGNTAALAGGLAAGEFYYIGGLGTVMVVY